jgi:mRNA interferase MazF
MTTLSRGSVVLVPFPFTDLPVVKRRPAVVVSSNEYNRATGDVIIAQITSKVRSLPRPGDHLVGDWKAAGLLLPSLVRARMTTLHASIVIKVLGAMPSGEMAGVERGIGLALDLPA